MGNALNVLNLKLKNQEIVLNETSAKSHTKELTET